MEINILENESPQVERQKREAISRKNILIITLAITAVIGVIGASSVGSINFPEPIGSKEAKEAEEAAAKASQAEEQVEAARLKKMEAELLMIKAERDAEEKDLKAKKTTAKAAAFAGISPEAAAKTRAAAELKTNVAKVATAELIKAGKEAKSAESAVKSTAARAAVLQNFADYKAARVIGIKQEAKPDAAEKLVPKKSLASRESHLAKSQTGSQKKPNHKPE